MGAQTTPTERYVPRAKISKRNRDIFGNDAARGWTSEVQLEAMDIEGIDVAVLYPDSRSTSASGRSTWTPSSPLRLRALTTIGFMISARRIPKRLIGAGMISPYSMEDAVSEARRCAEQLGFRAIFLRANPLVNHQWQSDYYEPLVGRFGSAQSVPRLS